MEGNVSSNREEILQDFQACTGIDDVGVCILHLEQSNWNLLAAVNKIIPQDIEMSQTTTGTEGTPVLSAQKLNVANSFQAEREFISNDDVALPSTSEYSRPLSFTIEYASNKIPLTVSDRDTIGTIKSHLYSQLGVPVHSQTLVGWMSNEITDSTRLSTLNLPKENLLMLIVKDSADDDALNRAEKLLEYRLMQTFQLKITNLMNKEEFSLNYPGSKTVQQVREDAFALTDIPVRHQLWTGWPENAQDDGATLASSGVCYPCHHLSLEMRNSSSALTTEPSRVKTATAEASNETSTSSGEEFEDANETFGLEDELFMQDVPTRRLKPLIPETTTSELEAVGCFITEFRTRYGNDHVTFYNGSLEDALKEAFHKPAKERKLLGVYLHHDGSILANVFCTQLLCSETVTSYLTANFVMWGWDVTHDSNRVRLLNMVTHHFGHVTSTTVKNFSVDHMPILMIIMKIRSTTEVFTVLHGSVSLDELLTRLIQAVEVFTGQQKIEIQEEDHREAREQVKREQDEAYEASLLADRAKEEAKKLEEAEKQRVILRQQCEAERQEQIRIEEEAAKTAIRQSLEKQLPQEPDGANVSACHIRFRLPSGEVIFRRFLTTDSLQVLLDFLMIKGYSNKDYKILGCWPRVDLTLLNPEHSFEMLNLCPQETITLEER